MSSDKVIIYFDGGARGNGKIDCLAGWAFIDESTQHSGSDYAIGATNNEMEYEGLYQAMLHAAEMEYENVEFRGDSQLVVEQVNSRWKCKAENLKLRCQWVKNTLSIAPDWSVTWVPREENPADYYYNEMLDRV